MVLRKRRTQKNNINKRIQKRTKRNNLRKKRQTRRRRIRGGGMNEKPRANSSYLNPWGLNPEFNYISTSGNNNNNKSLNENKIVNNATFNKNHPKKKGMLRRAKNTIFGTEEYQKCMKRQKGKSMVSGDKFNKSEAKKLCKEDPNA